MDNMVIAGNDTRGQGAAVGSDSPPAKKVWTGRIINVLVILFLLVDAIPKLLRLEFAVDATVELGYPDNTVVWIGLALLVCTVLYTVPRTSILGAVLLTGYLGGATATQVQLDEPWALVFPVVFGVLVWVGQYLRDSRVRSLLTA